LTVASLTTQALGDLGVGQSPRDQRERPGGRPGGTSPGASLMSYLPVQPMIDAVTRALGPAAALPGRDLAVLAAWAAGGLLLSVRFFAWDPRRPRHARAAGRS
jgi:hypothetical protein